MRSSAMFACGSAVLVAACRQHPSQTVDDGAECTSPYDEPAVRLVCTPRDRCLLMDDGYRCRLPCKVDADCAALPGVHQCEHYNGHGDVRGCFGTSNPAAARLRDALVVAVPTASVRPSRTPSALDVGVGETHTTLSYASLQRDCDVRPDTCDRALAAVVHAFVATVSDGAKAAPTLATLSATLKDQMYIDNASADGGTPLLARPFLDVPSDLWVVLTRESPDQGFRTLLSRDDLKTSALTEDQLFARARQNIDDTFGRIVLEPYEPGSPVRVVDDESAAALPIPANRWESVAQEVQGDLVLSVPSAHILLYTGDRPASNVAALRALTAKLERTEPHPVSRTLLRWTKKGWEPLDSPRVHP